MGLAQTVKLPPRQVSLPYSAPPSTGVPSTWSSPQQSPWPSPNQSPCYSPWGTPRGGSSFEIDDLYLEGAGIVDPTQPPLKGQLLQKLRVQPNALVEPMRGGLGSCNAGMWIIRDASQSFVLKLVRDKHCFMGPQQAAEADKFAKLSREHPGIVKDPSLAFPCKIFRCLNKGGVKTHDLVVMRQVPGVRVSDFIMQMLHGKQVQDLMRVLEQFGSFLADFHARYGGMQHGDLTPANVFFDPQTARFTLVDVADLAPRNPVIQSDTERFTSSLRLLSSFYGPGLFMDGKARFEAGYTARRSGMPLRPA